MQKKTIGIGLVALLLIAAIISILNFSDSLISTGDYSTKLACDQKRQSLLSGSYVACTECATKYASGGGYAAGCFLSGTRGEECLKAGGTCSDTSCSECSGQTRTCTETNTFLSKNDGGSIYQIQNWGDVCDKSVLKIECDSGKVLSGRQYSTTRSMLGVCVSSTPVETTTCSPKYDTVCDTTDSCGGTRATEGITCGNGNTCMSEQCVDTMQCFELTECDGTTLKTDSQLQIIDGKSGCVFQTAVVNSEQCGFLAPPSEDPVVCEGCDAPITDETVTNAAIDREEPGFFESIWNWFKGLFSL